MGQHSQQRIIHPTESQNCSILAKVGVHVASKSSASAPPQSKHRSSLFKLQHISNKIPATFGFNQKTKQKASTPSHTPRVTVVPSNEIPERNAKDGPTVAPPGRRWRANMLHRPRSASPAMHNACCMRPSLGLTRVSGLTSAGFTSFHLTGLTSSRAIQSSEVAHSQRCSKCGSLVLICKTPLRLQQGKGLPSTIWPKDSGLNLNNPVGSVASTEFVAGTRCFPKCCKRESVVCSPGFLSDTGQSKGNPIGWSQTRGHGKQCALF